MALIPYLYKRLRAYGVPHDQAIIIADPDEDDDFTGIHQAVDDYLIANPPGGGTGAVDTVNTRTGNVVLTSADVGLANVTNTSDANKPVSTAQQTALNLKANIASPTFTGTVGGVTQNMVGLSNVDNTADADKPVSDATQTALDLKAPIASPTFTGTVSGVSKTAVGLGNVDNTTDAGKPVSTATQTALDLKAPLASPTFTGTVAGITKTMVGLGSVDNTADTAKPVSTAQQTALDLKGDLAEVFHTKPTTALSTTLPRNAYMGNALSAVANGGMYLVGVYLRAGQVVHSIAFCSGATALSAGTHQWFALYNPSRSLLGVTSDDTSTAWAANTLKNLNLASDVTVATTGMHFLGIVVTATTRPTMTGTTQVHTAITGRTPVFVGQSTTGLTDPASAPSTAGSITGNPENFTYYAEARS